jgi:hypothetical protein
MDRQNFQTKTMNLLEYAGDDCLFYGDEGLDQWGRPFAPQPTFIELEDLRAQCFCAGCGARIGRTGAFWRWPTLGIVTCAYWPCYENYRNNAGDVHVWAARDRIVERMEKIPVSKPGRNAPTLRQFIDLVLPVK